ncbi:MAG TPA: TonB-dependent receptor [Steroidobacteraceae bacterium]|nr:TonB-dependent receptor [Steroidobacteraceae bacterium]
MTSGIRVLRPLVIAPLALATLLPCLAQAQIEEIIVTAQKREENLQNVGISMSAFSAEQLENLGVKNTTDITQQVPGLQFSAWSPEFTTFSLRGISQTNFQDNLEAPVAVYMDGVYVASMNAISAQMFDMDRIEVLRGPQGTLFGRNATGGLLQFVTHKATSDTANGYLEASGGEWNDYSVEGAFGGAFSERVRGRIAGRWEQSDGYLKAGSVDFGDGNGPIPATSRTASGLNGFALRGNLQADLSDNVLFDLTLGYSRDNDVPTGQYVVTFAGFDPVTGLGAFTNAVDPATGNITTFPRTPITGSPWKHWSSMEPPPYLDRDVKSATAQFTAKLGGSLEFVSLTNWMDMHKFYIEDSAGGLAFFPYNTINDYDQFSQEFRLSGSSDKARWQAGAYYLNMTWDTFQSVAGAAILGGTSDTQKMSTFGKVDSRNWSVFGQVEFDLSNSLTLIAGGRWSQDDKSLDMNRIYEDVPQGIDPTEVFNIDAVAIPGIETIDYGDYAARLQLNWKPAEHTLVYLSWNRGIKGGNWSLDPLGGVADADLKHGPEKLQAYELGLKTDFWGGKARLNTAAFYYDYNDYQAFSIVNLTPQVTNSDADAHGGEIEFTLSPTNGLTFLVGAAFVDSKVDAVPTVFGATVEAEFPLAPRTSINLLGRYEWPAFGGSLAAQVDGRWNDDQFLEGTNSEVSSEPSYSVWNASVSWSSANDKTRLTAWCKNLTDEEYRLYDLDLGLLGFIEQAYGPPRQFGVTVSYHW